MDFFVVIITMLALIFLVNSCIEVGSNDATNLVNAVYGSQVLKRRTAIVLAGLFVVLGASFSSPVMDTVRKSIFDIKQLDLYMSLSVFIAAYFVSIMLLYVYSVFGMPVSTTATLVFCLAGGACGVLGSSSAVNWPKFSQVILAILMSIFVSGIFAFLTQKVFRFYLGHDIKKRETVIKHGSWIASLMLVTLLWFMMVKGMKHVSYVGSLSKNLSAMSLFLTMFSLWIFLTISLHLVLNKFGAIVTNNLFRVIAVLGMFSMAFAFGQNDLANCASPGVAIYMMWSEGLSDSLKMNVPIWVLATCGFLMFIGMMTQRAKRVTMAEVKTGSQKGHVSLYAPLWCQKIASFFLKSQRLNKLQSSEVDQRGLLRDTGAHYDALRASVILSVSACVIAFASGRGLPVSTTYVAFAAVVASGWGDDIFSGGQATLKIGRSLWVVSGWFMGAATAFICSFIIAMLIFKFRFIGLSLALGLFFLIKAVSQRQSQIHAELYDESMEPNIDALTHQEV